MAIRYRVTFVQRTNAAGDPVEFPPDYVTADLPDGVIIDQTFVERTVPDAEHSSEALEEDDDFLSLGSETWDYEIAEGRENEFRAAIKNSQAAIEFLALGFD